MIHDIKNLIFRWRFYHPFWMGLAEGVLASHVLLLALGFAGALLSVPAWTLLVWSLLSYRRPFIYQMTCAAGLAITGDFASGALIGSSFAVFAGALILANIAAPGDGQRWEVPHALFSVRAIAGGWGALLVLSHLFDGMFAPPALRVIASTILAGLLISLLIFIGSWINEIRNTRHPHPINMSRFDR